MPEIISKKPTIAGAIISILGLLMSGWGIVRSDWKVVSIGLAVAFLPLGSAFLAFLSAGVFAELITRVIPSMPVEGQAVPIIIRLNNTRKFLLIIAEAKDTPPNGVKTVGGSKLKLFAPPGGMIAGHYFLIARSGKRKFGKLVAKIYDPLGLYMITITLTPNGETYLQTRPKVEEKEVKEVAEQEMVTLMQRLARGPGLEFYEIREYQEGDDPRLIDWKATARLGKLIVKEMRRESSSPIIIIIAPGPKGDEGPPYKTSFEKSARIASGIVDILSAKGANIGYISLTTEPVIVPPSTGPRAQFNILSGIASTPPSSTLPSNLRGVVREYLFNYVRARPLIVIISPKNIVNLTVNELNQVVQEVKGKLFVIGV